MFSHTSAKPKMISPLTSNVINIGNAFVLDIISDRIIACGAAVAAFLSALYAYNSNRISQKALDIASTEHELKKDNLEFYLVDSFKIRTKKIQRNIQSLPSIHP